MHRARLSLAAAVLAVLPGVARFARADYDFVAECHDGQAPTPSMACDVDGRANGTCTIGQSGGRTVTARTGGATDWTSANGVVGHYTCLAAVPRAAGEAPPAAGVESSPKHTSTAAAPGHHPISSHAVFLYPPPPGGLPTSSSTRHGSKGGKAGGGRAAPPAQKWKVTPVTPSTPNLAGAVKGYTSGLAGGARKASSTAGALSGAKK